MPFLPPNQQCQSTEGNFFGWLVITKRKLRDNNNNNNRFMALCPGLLGWAGSRRNTHPPTILVIQSTTPHLCCGKNQKKNWTSFSWWRSLVEIKMSKVKMSGCVDGIVFNRQHCVQHAAQSAGYLSKFRGRFWGPLPHRGDSLHWWGWNLACPLFHTKFHPIGGTIRA